MNNQDRILEIIREDCKSFAPNPSILRRDDKGQANLINLGNDLYALAKNGHWFKIKKRIKNEGDVDK